MIMITENSDITFANFQESEEEISQNSKVIPKIQLYQILLHLLSIAKTRNITGKHKTSAVVVKKIIVK